MSVVVIGTRGSPLALAQCGRIRDVLAGHWPRTEFRLQIIKTGGDAWAAQPGAEQKPPPGKGVFTREIEEALRAHAIDLAVHSLKDLPVADSPGLILSATPERADARDVLVVRAGMTLATLPSGARIGTGSLRRSAQLRRLRPDLITGSIRGNIDTRLRRLGEGAWDGLILAAAGLERLGPSLDGLAVIPLDLADFLPAPGQGALALQSRADDLPTAAFLSVLHHSATHAAVRAERAFLAGLGGGCLSPVGAHGAVMDGRLDLRGIAWLNEAPDPVSGSLSGPAADPEALGEALAKKLQSS